MLFYHCAVGVVVRLQTYRSPAAEVFIHKTVGASAFRSVAKGDDR